MYTFKLLNINNTYILNDLRSLLITGHRIIQYILLYYIVYIYYTLSLAWDNVVACSIQKAEWKRRYPNCLQWNKLMQFLPKKKKMYDFWGVIGFRQNQKFSFWPKGNKFWFSFPSNLGFLKRGFKNLLELSWGHH